MTDINAAFGTLPEQAKIATFMRILRSLPRNWLGQQIAQICRKLVLWKATLPIDVEVDGVRLRVYLADNNSEKKFVFMPWRFDQKERDLLVKKLPADGVFVDIGANVGIYSLWAAKHMSKNGTIVAFEPNPPAHSRLTFNIDANAEVGGEDWPQIICIPKGVSDTEGQFSLFLDPQNLGGSSLVLDSSSGSEVSIECVTLLDQIQALGVDRIDALKIDIEGAEEKALYPFFKNASRDLLPKIMIVECTHRDFLNTPLGDRLEALGYEALTKTKMNTVYVLD